jgi:hypothetical protein
VGLLRSILGVVAGYAVFALCTFGLFVLTGRDPHDVQSVGFTVLSIVFGMIAAAAGGYVAAAIASGAPRAHAGIVAALIALGATASLISQPGTTARWSQLSALLLMAPAAFVGGSLKRSRASRAS